MSNERVRRMRAVVEQLTPLATRDPNHWNEPLDLARERLRRTIATVDTKNFWRGVATARAHHERLRETHVIVGDDPPEPRTVHA